MVNRIAHLCDDNTAPSNTPVFGDLRKLQPPYLLPPICEVPPLVATEFLDLLRASISLGLVEKCYILLRLPNMPSDMIQELIEAMREEQRVFRNLPASHQLQLRQLEDRKSVV